MLKQVLEKLNKNSEYLSLFNELLNNEKISVFSASFSEKMLIANDINLPFCIVAPNNKEAQKIKEHFTVLGKKVSSIFYKTAGYIYHTAEQGDIMEEYYKTLYEITQNEVDVVVITAEVLMQKLPPKEKYLQHILPLEVSVTYDLETLSKHLIKIGYKREAMVEKAGDFSLRGDILDIFCPHSPLPYRIQFFDDEIENIKTFNTLTYTTIGQVQKILIPPNTLTFILEEVPSLIQTIKNASSKVKLEPNYMVRLNNILEHIFLHLSVLRSDASSFWCVPFFPMQANILDYLEGAPVVFWDTKMITDELNLLFDEFYSSIKSLQNAGEVLKEHKNYYFTKEEILNIYESHPLVAYQNITSQNRLFLPSKVYSFRTIPVSSYVKNYQLLLKDVSNHIKNKRTVLLAGENASSSVYLEKFLKTNELKTHIITNYSQIVKNEVNIVTTSLKEGVTLLDENLVIIGSEQLFEKSKVVVKTQKQKKRTFTMPKIGDYVVHDVHGIGLCKAIERLKLSGYEKDYILIEYAGGDTLYLPTEQVELISSYVGGDEAPKLNKLGGVEFSRQKEKVYESVKKMAVDLISLYASRQKRQGFSFVKDDEVQRAFEGTFNYTETEDQLTAISEVKADMESAKIMDRLICGDVGYGKTEVALRAAFKAVLSGKQVAFLAPTTILSEQHYNTCVARMGEFMVACDVLNRFKSTKEIKKSLENLQNGTTNVICGTHRLLSKDVKFKDLGLLILDEEQRFGVADKEKIKELKKNIDVLTMSATPIPRTLHMSMIGVRDISLIETAPQNRLPVQTFVTEYSNALLLDAVLREKSRNGQVLIIHNRVESIYQVYEKLRALLPNVIMKVAHGQMQKHELEYVIKDLYDGKIDVLLATTLIENGIDLPNANTLIVLNSDQLGLSQLYQLRGRVGRSSRLGYAYFTYEKQKVLSESAYKRLNAINEFTELGSGFKIALRDLEIRGAGNILGREQHGHMGRVGYDMYCKILEKAVKEIKGEKELLEREVKMDIELNAYIPSNYITEDENRFRVYAKFSEIESEENFTKTIQEVKDIYGELPKEVYHLAKIAYMKNLAVKLKLKTVRVTSNIVLLEFYEKETALQDNISKALSHNKQFTVLKFENTAKIIFQLNEYSADKKLETVLNFLKLSSQI